MLFHADISDEDDSVNSPDTSSTLMTCNNHEPLTPIFKTNTGIAMTNDFSWREKGSIKWEMSGIKWDKKVNNVDSATELNFTL